MHNCVVWANIQSSSVTKCSFSLTLKVENVTVRPPPPHKVNYTMGKYTPDKRSSLNAWQEMCVPAEQLAVSL